MILVKRPGGQKWHNVAKGGEYTVCGQLLGTRLEYRDKDLVDSVDRCQNPACKEARGAS